jgi:hypothetical protein
VSNAIRSFGRTTFLAVAALAPVMLLAACDSSNASAEIEKQVAIAQEAADRAVAAQKAAERAAKLARAQSGSVSFAEDEVIEEIDDSSEEEMSDSSDGDGGGEVLANGEAGPPPPTPH